MGSIRVDVKVHVVTEYVKLEQQACPFETTKELVDQAFLLMCQTGNEDDAKWRNATKKEQEVLQNFDITSVDRLFFTHIDSSINKR